MLFRFETQNNIWYAFCSKAKYPESVRPFSRWAKTPSIIFAYFCIVVQFVMISQFSTFVNTFSQKIPKLFFIVKITKKILKICCDSYSIIANIVV